MAPRYPADLEDELDGLNSQMEGLSSSLGGVLDNTPADLSQGHGVSMPRSNADLVASGYDATIKDTLQRKEIADKTALDRLQEALSNKPEISASQGFAAALLAALPTIGGLAIQKGVGTADIPEGTYFPGMSGQDFNQEFGNNAGAEGAKLGGEVSSGYLKGISDEQMARTPLLMEASKMAEKQADTLGQQAAYTEQAGLQQEQINQRARESNQLRRELAGQRPRTIEDEMTPEQRKARAAQLAGVDASGKPLPPKPYQLSTGMTNDIALDRALANSAWDISLRVPTNFKTWAELQAANAISTLDQGTVMRSLNDFADRIGRGRSGAAITPEEYKKLRSFILGDGTLTPIEVQKYLQSYARDTMFLAKNLKESAEMLHDPEKSKTMFELPGDAPATTTKTGPGDIDRIMNDPNLSPAQKSAEIDRIMGAS